MIAQPKLVAQSGIEKSDTLTQLSQKEKEKQEWLWRIKQDTLDGVYIPKDLEDCLSELDKIMSEKDQEEFRQSNPISYHLGFGRHLRNRWGLWTSSRLQEYFLDLGVTHPDNMSGIILDSYHRHLNGKEINLNKQLNQYHLKLRPKLKIPQNYKTEGK